MKRLLTAGAIGLWVLILAAPASAHAGLVSSNPANGSVLSTAPSAITLTFTEQPDPALSSIALIDSGGTAVPLGTVTVSGADGLTASVPSGLPEGVYTVSWRVVSSDDGHVTAGAFSFGIGMSPPTGMGQTATTTSRPSPLDIASKAALYAGLMLLVAIAVVGSGAFAGRPSSLPAIAVASAVLALAGAIGHLIATQRSVGVPMNDLLASPTGRPLTRLMVVVLFAAAAAVLGAARTRWRMLLRLAGGGAAAAMFVRASGGHPAAAAPPFLQETLQGIHFVAAGVWVGGLVLLVALLREATDPPIEAVRRFSRLAAIAVGLVVMTGLARAFSQLGGLSGLWHALSTAYGRTLAIKVLLVLALVALGARNRLRSIPRLASDPRPLRRLVRIEAIAAIGVLLLTATLTGLSPRPAGASAEPATPAGAIVGSDVATTTRVELTITPGTPGPNAFSARVLDFDSGQPADATGVVIRLVSLTHPDVSPVTLTLTRSGDAWVGQGTDLSLAGAWRATVAVSEAARTIEVPLTVVMKSAGATPPPGSTFGTTTFPSGVSIQLHLDPGSAGSNQLHVTVTAPDGSALAAGHVIAVGIPEAGQPVTFAPQDGPGRGTVAVPVELAAGTWTIDVVVTTPDGRTFQADLFGVPIA